MLLREKPAVPLLGGDGRAAIYPVQGETLVPRGDPAVPISKYEVEVDADASFGYESGVRSISWELRESCEFRARRAWADRRGEGPNHSELLAALHGLHAARLYGADSVSLRVDNKLTTGILSGLWTATQPNIRSLSNRVEYVLRGFRRFALTWVRTREIREVDAGARSLRKHLESTWVRQATIWDSAGERADQIKWRTGPTARVGFYRRNE